MNAEIISIGTELLMGETVDTNSSYIGEQLARIGIDLTWATKVGDHPSRLQEAIRRAWERSDVTITTGGLGPTSDDLTRESIAAVMGEEMEVQDDMLAHLRAQFETRGIQMPETNVKQATLIPSARVIPNPMGTAPGWWVERDSRVIAALPGPPREITGMWDSDVGPGLRALNPGVFIVTRTLKTFGITEGGLDEMLSPLFESENPSLGIYSKQDGIHLRAIARAGSEMEAQGLIEPMEAEIRRVAGQAIWGEDDDTAVTTALRALANQCLSLAIVEGFTGGLLSSTLLESPLSMGTLVGSVVLAADGSSAKMFGEIGGSGASPTPDHATRLATAVRESFSADVGLAVTGLVTVPTELSGPVGTTHIGIVTGSDSHIRSASYPTRRLRLRGRAVTHTLLELERVLETGTGGQESNWG
jgi:nicotinamide-nucleotide amidase